MSTTQTLLKPTSLTPPFLSLPSLHYPSYPNPCTPSPSPTILAGPGVSRGDAPTCYDRFNNRHRRSSGRQRDVAKARLLQWLYRSNPSVAIPKSWTIHLPPTAPSQRLSCWLTLTPRTPPPLDTVLSWLTGQLHPAPSY